MPKTKFQAQLDDVENLLSLAESITLRDPALSYLPYRPTPSPLLAGAVVLLCARFEEFIKDVIRYALERHNYAAPPITLWDLPQELQIRLISKNLTTALEGKRYGIQRQAGDRIAEGLTAANHVISGMIHAEYAIETGGNPGPETVKALMQLVGLKDPWKEITENFNANYKTPLLPSLAGIDVGKLEERLRQLLNSRNVVAHSGASIPVSSNEIRFDVHFMSQLSISIYEVLKKHVQEFASTAGRTPGHWNA
ncbi:MULTISPECIES: HEPN domain-containing protein [Streptomyces]|uniref:HEPN domain-containing protein n=1 Tax=Streptomyces TaxID=1883 RepID=UPI0012FEAF75|nr:HEPN domain-containing protein [Streptomyces exfoliatus]